MPHKPSASELAPPPSAVELAKTPPTLNASLDMKPVFRDMVNNFAREYGVNSTRIIEHLLVFTATTVPYGDVKAFIKAQFAPAIVKSRVRSARRKQEV